MAYSSATVNMRREDDFNQFAGEEFVKEYEHETGQRFRFKRVGDRFPDAILETSAGKEIGVEFVSVVLSFVNQEEHYFDKYREQFHEVLKTSRPRYKNVAITLQPRASMALSRRPMRLPTFDSAEGKGLIAEFRQLVLNYFDELLPTYGGLLDRLNVEGVPAFPVLMKYFDVLLLNSARDDDERKPHPDDPVITHPSLWYNSLELGEAVRRAVETKSAKGRAYATDLLVLHTLRPKGVPDTSGIGLSSEQIEAYGRVMVAQEQELCQRFTEIWFLNAYWSEQRKRLYRLK